MKKGLGVILALAVLFVTSPCFAAPDHGRHGGAGMGRPGGMGRPPVGSMHGGHNYHRPPMARPHYGRPPMHHVSGFRPFPPVYRPYRPYYSTYPRYYSSYTYVPVSTYYYDGLQPAGSYVNTVVVRDDYAGINTAANVINTAANVATAIRFLSW